MGTTLRAELHQLAVALSVVGQHDRRLPLATVIHCDHQLLCTHIDPDPNERLQASLLFVVCWAPGSPTLYIHLLTL